MSTEDLKGRWVTANRDNTPVLEYDPRYGVPVWKGGAGGKVAVVDARQDADQDIRNAAMEAAAIEFKPRGLSPFRRLAEEVFGGADWLFSLY